MSQERTYTIHRVAQPPRLAIGGWESVEPLAIDVYPWYQAGQKQNTRVALQYDSKALYALFVCEDKHIFAVTTQANGPVCLDSCVEFFATPEPKRAEDYFNFEANCCGTMLLGWGAGRPNRKPASEAILKQIRIVTSIPGPTRGETPGDDGWWLAAAIPFAAIEQLSGQKIAPKSGDAWRANFYRCGGKTDEQYGCWNPVTSVKPDYHRPECFGTLVFE